MTTSERQAEAVARALADGGWLRHPASVDLAGRIRVALESVPQEAPEPASAEPVPPGPGGVWECRRSITDAWQKCATQDPRKFSHGWQYRFVDPPVPLPCPCCRSKTGPERQEDGALVCDCGCVWFEDRRAPCPSCAQLRTELDCLAARNAALVAEAKATEAARAEQSNLAYQYRQRAEGLEARCAEALRFIAAYTGLNPSGNTMDRLREVLEARPC